jgi:hypothetical protein
MTKLTCVICISFIGIIFYTTFAAAAFDTFPTTVRSAGTATLSGASSNSIDGRFFNPASGSWIDGLRFNCGFKRPFELKELDQINVGIAKPIKKYIAGINLYGMSSDLYSESKVKLSISGRLFHYLALGASFSYSNISIKNYDNDYSCQSDIGVQYKNNSISIALYTDNLFATEFKNYIGSSVQKKFFCSTMINLNSKFRILNDINLSDIKNPVFAVGMETILFPSLAFRVGYNGQNQQIHIGIGIITGKIEFDTSQNHHPWIGWTRSFGFSMGANDD